MKIFYSMAWAWQFPGVVFEELDGLSTLSDHFKFFFTLNTRQEVNDLSPDVLRGILARLMLSLWEMPLVLMLNMMLASRRKTLSTYIVGGWLYL